MDISRMNIYVGNIDYTVNHDELKALFAAFGEIESIKFIEDRNTGKFKGLCFINIPDNEGAKEAIEKLDGFEINERKLRVMESKSPAGGKKSSAPRRGGGFKGGNNRSKPGGYKPGGSKSGGYKPRKDEVNGNHANANNGDYRDKFNGNQKDDFNRKSNDDSNNKFRSRRSNDDSFGNRR